MPKYYFEDFIPGSVDTYGPRHVTREEIIDFASQFDPQPMHLDEEAGRNSMLGGLAASGWGTCAMLMRMICDWFVLDSASLGAPGVDEVKWIKPVRPGDDLTLRRTIGEKRVSKSRPDMGFVPISYEMINQAGDVVMTMTVPSMMALRNPEKGAA
ncbi:bifunctional protein PaaZ [Variibacter gotjawalensis]|uniref:Bifunctional protein PaaZ n=1 Tax=Variibacter gotjawalensis TaxID=1333996 RepID=A0A0S3PTC6_9BRAD|nr:MaoC family dehydratase [Variibacter gotjawalensis]NIK49537.1 acyl dehydratase [Variibacter gotjawalensis]RZS51388.1 acyl dehydratase [Variibacter gotjawalensis]BAT59221.1 bifunctional protein PaaZ [Variibacter gotjawalensis]